MNVTGDSVDVTTYFVLRLAATGVEATGLTITDFDLQYTRSGVAPTAKVDATALAATDSVHADNKAIEIDATDQPGLYRVDWPDAAFAAGVKEVILTVKCASCFTEHLRVQIDTPVNVTKLLTDAQSATDLKDFADAGYDPSVNKVEGVKLTDTLTTYTGNTPQTGDSFARLGAPAGASIAADIAVIEAQTDDIGVAGAGLTALGDTRLANLDAAITTRLAPTTAGRTLDVTATGAAGVDWGNVENPSTAVNLSATNIDVDQVVASVSGAVGSVTGAVGSVTAGVTLAASAVQAIWDALTSALTTVGSIGKLLVDNINATISSRLASASYTTPPTAAAIADQVWEEAIADHSGTAGSTAEALSAAGSAGDPWSTALPGAYGAGTAGKIVGDNLNATVGSRATQTTADAIEADTQDLQSRTPAALVSGRMDASVGAMAANTLTASAVATDAVTEIQSGLSTLDAAGVRTAVGLASANLDTQLTAIDDFLDTEVAAIKAKTDNLPASPANEATLTTIAGYIDTEVAAIKAKTDNLPASPAAVGSAMTLTSGERDSIAAAALDLANGVETGVTLRQAQRIQLSSAAGKLSGAATATVAIRDTNDTKDRITATVDASGNRTAVTLDAS